MSKAKNLGPGASFGQARPVSARRAAIGAATAAPTVGVPDPTELPVGLISQNPDNPREELRDLEGLAESIREIGLINAITVATVDAYLSERPDRASEIEEGARYIVVDGHRRLAAARLAEARTIKVSVDNDLVSTDESLLEAAFVANVHRDDMNPLEQAHALRKLVEFYGSQNKAAKRLGIAQSTISSKLSILDLDPQLQADLVAGHRKIEHVRNLSKLSPAEQVREADARAAAASERKRGGGADLSRRDNPAGRSDEADDLSRRDNPGLASELSRRDGSEVESAQRDGDLSRRDNPGVGPELSRRDNPGAGDEVSRRDTPAIGADLSRRDNPGPTDDVPAPREAPSPPKLAGIKMPWHDGDKVADLVLEKMLPQEREKLLRRLLSAREAVRPASSMS
ncbi:ParB/RepB/Spo0J family partition protein [Streptomyces sp. NPDC049837]|uniref:ParB/RepB/Spo0J family partition protein n=1 Tax=Streptomyces sp. NPDC049837 TaxID=3155277 RepID=UPI0034370839